MPTSRVAAISSILARPRIWLNSAISPGVGIRLALLTMTTATRKEDGRTRQRLRVLPPQSCGDRLRSASSYAKA
jgi:hypothetical protein